MLPNPRSFALSRRGFLGWTAALGALVAGGCAPSHRSGPPPTVSLIQAQLPFDPSQLIWATEQSAAARESGSNLNLSVQTTETLRSKLGAATAAAQLPDVALLDAPDFGLLAGKGLLTDVREALDRVAGLNGDLFPPLRALATAGPFADRDPHAPVPAYGIPAFSIGWGFLARRDVLDRKGVDPPKDFDSWRAAAIKLADSAAGVAGFGATLPAEDATDQLTQIALLAHGASLFDSAGFQVTFPFDAGTAGLAALASLYQPDHGVSIAPAGVVGWPPDALATALANARIALGIDPGGLYGQLVRADPKLRNLIQVLPPPTGPGGWFTSAEVSLYAVPRGAAADRALAFVERVLQPARVDLLTRGSEAAIVPPYAYLTKEPYWDADPNYAALFGNTRGDPARGFSYANPGSPGPLTPPVALVWQRHLLADAAREVVLGRQSPADAAKFLGESAASLVPTALDLQPRPTATPVPGWMQWLQGG